MYCCILFSIDVFVSGNYAFVTGWGGLEIVDVSNPEAPVHTSNIADAGGESVYVSGNYAYVATGNSGKESDP